MIPKIKILISMLVCLSAFSAVAAIPRSSFIVGKMAANAGSGTYSIEQDVTFSTAQSTLVLRESWLVSTDGQMRVSVKPARDTGEQVRIQFVYGGGQKSSLTQSGKRSGAIGEEFLEKLFHLRSREGLFNQLVNLKIQPSSYLAHKPSRSGKEFVYPSEPLVRLTRVGGVSVYGLGEPSSSDSDTKPMAWVEQDVFHLRKIRYPSGTVMTADRYGTYARELALPKSRHILWGDRGSQKAASIEVVKVASLATTKNDKRFAPASLEFTSQIGLADSEMQKLVEEFYQRFR